MLFLNIVNLSDLIAAMVTSTIQGASVSQNVCP